MTAMAALLEELQGEIPEVLWELGDDLCDCTFQYIRDWTNPYLGRTRRIRMCCLFKEFEKQYPWLFEEIPAYYDHNEAAYIPALMDWDSENSDMPRALWYRQVAAKTGDSLERVRDRLRGQTPPGPVPRGTGRKGIERRVTWISR